MQASAPVRLIILLAGFGLLAVSNISGYSQGSVSMAGPAAAILPDAPGFSAEIALAEPPDAAAQDAQAEPPVSVQSGQSSSSSGGQSSSPQKPGSTSQSTPESEHQQAEQQLKAEEKQRVLGVAPNFGVSYKWNAAPLSAGQKMQLAFRSATDPFTFAAAGLVAGLHEALDDDTGFGWGATGYGKRTGAAYLDAFDGAMIGNGILPAILRQDPRYFRLGHGTVSHRLLYAIGTSYICRGDNGHWQPNISNVGGNIIAGAISNYYYPAQNSGWGRAVTNGFIVTTEGTVGGIFDEFWPDIDRKILHRSPHGATTREDSQPHPQQQNQSPAGK